MHPERRNITEDRIGLPLRIGLRLVDAQTGTSLVGVAVEVWHADHAGRYAGFAPFTPRPGEVITSASVPNEIVAPSETFLRGMQRTDPDGMCMFETIYPGWYASRTVHIHVAARLPTGHRAVSQLYFPDELTEQVFTRPPYAGRPPRDITNATDSIFADGGSRTVLQLTGDAAGGLTGVLCLGIEPELAPVDSAAPAAVARVSRRLRTAATCVSTTARRRGAASCVSPECGWGGRMLAKSRRLFAISASNMIPTRTDVTSVLLTAQRGTLLGSAPK